MPTVLASVVSAPAPIDGNTHNSSPDFQFVLLPSGGNLTIQVTDNPNADSITFNLWRDISAWPDSEIQTNLHNGATMPAEEVNGGDSYYIGDPSGAGGQNFTVTFYGP